MNFIVGVRTDETEAAVADAFARLAGWVKAQKIPAAVPPSRLALSGQMPSAGGGGIPSDDWILRLGRCEQPGNGWEGIQWNSRGGYPGGMGFLPGAWARVRDPAWPASMADAEPWMQIEAVRRLGAQTGFTPNVWGCINTIGTP